MSALKTKNAATDEISQLFFTVVELRLKHFESVGADCCRLETPSVTKLHVRSDFP